MSERAIVHLPDLTGPEPPPAASGWMALDVEVDPVTAAPRCAVPSRDDARRCAHRIAESDPCAPRIVSFDPPDGTALIALGAGGATVSVRVSPGFHTAFPASRVPVLRLRPVSPAGPDVTRDGQIAGPCGDRLVFRDAITGAIPDGDYDLSVDGYTGGEARITVALAPPHPPRVTADPCALTLSPGTAPAGVALGSPPPLWPPPPLLAVDERGCIVAAWSVDEHGWVLVPRADGGVDLLQGGRGGLRASIHDQAPIRDAIFWQGTIAVLTATTVTLHDLGGGPLSPAISAGGFVDAVALGITAEGFLVVVDRGARPNVTFLRRDGSRVAPPAAFGARGWYARRRSAAFDVDRATGGYFVEPARAVSTQPSDPGCCAMPARSLTDAEALFFQLVDDLPDLRQRAAYPACGWVILGPAQPEDALDAGRPGTQWHRILLFGEIPGGCAVGIETRAFDDLLAGDPLVTAGWSTPVVATAASAGPVAAPGDTRIAAADAMVLAGPGRYLWIRLTLRGDGRATPRITAVAVERPREGTSRFLPRVYRDSTPEDDFLRRWLALFEAAAWNGIAERMDAYAQLFDPRTAPAAMLPYLASWLDLAELPAFRADPVRLRRILLHGAKLARTRGTLEGLALVVRLYLGIHVQIVESFRTRSRFVLGCGRAVGSAVGPVLGCDTVLGTEPSPTYLDDAPPLGCSFLLDCEDRDGAIAWHFDVLVPARAVCTSEALAFLRSLIEAEKPAHTTYGIRLVAPAGWVVGASSVVGQELGAHFDRRKLDPATYGIALLNGPPRPKPIGGGFLLGYDSRLAAATGPPAFQLDATVGKTTRLGA